jgi:hypothetical protein
MPFGLTNAPAVFMATMNDMLSDLPFCTVYLDDILIFSKSPKEHVSHVRQVLERLEQNQFLIKLSKCDFFKPQVKYLGHIVSADGIQPDPSKIKSVTEWPTPKTVHDIRSFLGMANYFRRYIQSFATITEPLVKLTRIKCSKRQSSSTTITWNPECQNAFDTLKQKLTKAPVLKLPDLSQPFQVITDASDYALGAILIQNGHPIAFESKQMNQAEKNYHTTDKELLAIVHALKIWRCYLEGSTFEVFTDHNPLTHLQTQPILSRRQTRWSEFLSNFQFKVDYKPGVDNPSDALSRLKPTETHVCVLGATKSKPKLPKPLVQGHHNTLPEIITISDLLLATLADPWFLNPASVAHLHKDMSGLYWNKDRVVVPHDTLLRQKILTACHGPTYTGHMSISKTLHFVNRFFWWPQMKKDVETFVKTCDACQRVKNSTHKPYGLLQPLPIPSKQWSEVTMDFIVELPVTQHKHNAIFVFTDKLTKMVHFAPTTTECTAIEAAKIFIDNVFKLHGLPIRMIHDRDTRFMSHFWAECFRILNVTQSTSTAFHPQTDGQTEKVNKVLEDYLRYYVNEHQNDWDNYLSLAEFAYNNSLHASTNNTPFRLNYNFDPLTPLSFLSEPHQTMRQQLLHNTITKCPGATTFTNNLQNILENAKKFLQAAQQRQKAYADKHRQNISFPVGSQVLLSTKNMKLKSSGSRKLLPRFVGPFTIKQQVNNVAYKLDLPKTLKIHPVFHVSLLRHYHANANCKAPPLPTVIDGELEYEVESIQDHKITSSPKHQQLWFLIRWKGYTENDDTWEPETHLSNCRQLLQNYKKLHKLK